MSDAQTSSHSAAPLISVVVCTRDRAGVLRTALASLADQSLDPAAYEVLVIDNQSADETPKVADEFVRDRANFRRIVEPEIGLSRARNRGWREARGRYAAYLDDDARAPREWLARAAAVIAERAPEIFGGPYRAFYSGPKPAWFKDDYASSKMDRAAGPLGENEFLSGTNMFYRREALEALGGFDPSFGMTGVTLGYGEETDLQARFRRARPGAEIYFDPALAVEHLVAPEKMRWRGIARQRFNQGRDVSRLFGAEEWKAMSKPRLAAAFARTLLGLGFDALARAPLRDRTRYPHIRNYLFEQSAAYIIRLGAISGEWARRP